ncbi:MAG: response regulator [Oscillatoriophycideae cyanobacterium NC_groundwater_1537_Pr4_S-0.65um_50_18]|nr:response regulator [Oscillatoriophycideae cyanobacterium NC_groundwater_1537_Pr4_S-0.65um_50_18]
MIEKPTKAILFVDDEGVILEALKEQLKRLFGHKYVYEAASSADEAWEVLEDLLIEDVEVLILVSDWLMPGTKGDEFLVQIHQKYPSIVKVMLTGQADEAAIARAYEQANLHRCLSKPWSEEDLADAIISGLEQGTIEQG